MGLNPGYKQTDVGVIPEEWEVVSIGSLASFTSGSGISVAALCRQSSDTPVPVFGGNGIAGYTTRPLVQEPVVVVGRVGQKCGEVYLTEGPAWITDNALYPRTIFRPLIVPFFALAMKAAGLNDVKNRNDLPLVTQLILHAVRIAWPPNIGEQRAIAGALSDVDALLAALDQLIAKKRDLKQAAMQQLLTGQTRLPRFHGEWVVKRLGEIIVRLKKTNRQSSEGKAEGAFPFFTNSTKPPGKFLDEADFDSEVIIANTGGEAFFNYYKGAFAAMADCFVFETKIVARFLHYFLKSIERVINDNGFTGSGIKHLDKKFFSKIELHVPMEQAEQAAIASALSDMDAEVAALEERRDKTRLLKQGMMQELLTGKTRLV